MSNFLLVEPCPIGKVRERFGWLGNMSPHPVVHEGITWPTAEALFQALRFAEDDPIRVVLLTTSNPMRAKMLAKPHASRRRIQPMSEEDLANMTLVLSLKLRQHEAIRDVLTSTGTRPIVEDATRRRSISGLFWGAAHNADGTWVGDNWLGKLWGRLRTP